MHNMKITEIREFIDKVKDLDIIINEGKNKMNDRFKINMKALERDYVPPIDDSERTPSISDETKQAYLQYMKSKVNRLNYILNELHKVIEYIQDNMEHIKNTNQEDFYNIAQNMKTISNNMVSINDSLNAIVRYIPDDYDQDYYNDPNEFV